MADSDLTHKLPPHGSIGEHADLPADRRGRPMGDALEIERREQWVFTIPDRPLPWTLGFRGGREDGRIDGNLAGLAEEVLTGDEGEVELDRAEGLVEGIVEE